MDIPQSDYDSAWKIALDNFLPQCLELFFPLAFEDIDWMQGFEFLDKELQKVMWDVEVGKRFVDKLVKVWRKDGQKSWVIIHIEVQSQVDASFSERMFVYYYRLYDRYKKQVVSLAILGDENAQWRPKEYSSELWGCGIRMWYPIAKLDDYRQQWHELQKSTNPFAVVVMAYLKAQETKDNLDERWHWKLNLIRGLYEMGWSKENIINLFRFIDWVLAVPKEMEQSLAEKIGEIEEEKQVNYLSPFEQLAIDKGVKQGVEQGVKQGVRLTSQENIATIIRARFGQPSQTVTERLLKIENIETLKTLVEKAVLVNSLKEFEQVLD